MLNKILEKIGLKYEDLTPDERVSLNKMSEGLTKKNLTVADVRTYISSMKESVEQDLTKTDLNTKQDIFLKARLRNYMLLDSFLSTPEKAKQAIERQISGIVASKNNNLTL